LPYGTRCASNRALDERVLRSFQEFRSSFLSRLVSKHNVHALFSRALDHAQPLIHRGTSGRTAKSETYADTSNVSSFFDYRRSGLSILSSLDDAIETFLQLSHTSDGLSDMLGIDRFKAFE
jgi:hypothetical protein